MFFWIRKIYAQLGYKDLKRTAQFRMSSHQNNIETGRYGFKYGNVLNRICEHCSTDDKETLELLKESPFFESIVEDEFHVLNSCSRYADAKTKVKDTTAQLMNSPFGMVQIFLDSVAIKNLAKFLRKCHSIKFPKNKAKEPAAKVPPNASVAQTQKNSTRGSVLQRPSVNNLCISHLSLTNFVYFWAIW